MVVDQKLIKTRNESKKIFLLLVVEVVVRVLKDEFLTAEGCLCVVLFGFKYAL